MLIASKNSVPERTYPVPEPGPYTARLVGWSEPEPSKYADRDTGEYPMVVKLRYAILDWDEGDFEIASKKVDPRFPDGKELSKHLKALLGRTPDDDEEIDLEALIGKRVGIVVVHNDTGERTYANIDTIYPEKKAKKAAAPVDFPED